MAGALAARARADQAIIWRAFSALRVHAVRSRMARMAVARWSSTMAARCFEAWRAQAAYSAHIRRGATELLLRSNRRLAWEALQEWRGRAWFEARMQRADGFWAERMQHGVFRAWLRRTRAARRAAALHDTLSSRWSAMQKALAFAGWRDAAAARAAQRALEGRAAARWRLRGGGWGRMRGGSGRC